jgi:hypothetical protein
MLSQPLTVTTTLLEHRVEFECRTESLTICITHRSSQTSDTTIRARACDVQPCGAKIGGWGWVGDESQCRLGRRVEMNVGHVRS